MRAVYPYVHTLQLHNCIGGVLSIKDSGVIDILAKPLRRLIELLLL